VRDPGRLAAVRATGLLDAPSDPALDRLAGLTARVLDAPVAMVTIVDEERQFLASAIGLAEPLATERETPLSYSICQHTVSAREALVLSDARQHPVLRDNLAVTELGIVAYAGVPLVTRQGHALGALCAMDRRPRAWTRDQISLLADLGASVISEIELAAARRAVA
jgi:GAF domain-containing protein